MRVLLTTLAATTHFYSMVPLAWALRSAGHEVRVAVQPGLVPRVTAAGLTAVAVGTDAALPMPTNDDVAHRPFGNIDFERFYAREVDTDELLAMFTILVPTYFAGANDPLVGGLVEFAAEWRPDLVVWEPMTWAGGIAARACGARHARLQWGPDVLGRAVVTLDERLAAMHEAHREDPLREWLRWTADRVGVAWAPDIVLGQWTMEVEPPRFRLDTGLDRMTVGYVPYNGPAVVPDWLASAPQRPRVCLTLGVSSRDGTNHDAFDIVEVVRELATLDVEIVVTLPDTQREQLGTVPRNVRVVDFVALDVLLPTCAVIVHHGGAGTWSTALRHGVPQVVLGRTWDAALKARMIDEAGGGVNVSSAEADGICDAVQRVLTAPSYRETAARLRHEVRSQPTPAEAVGEIERRVGTGA